MRFWRCFWYLIEISIAAFFVGRLLPKKWFRADLFPYRAFQFEKNGRIYNKLNIRRWQNKVPDMSRMFLFMMPAKRISVDCVEKIPRMIQETCVAEFIHGMNCIAGLYCLRLYPGIGGIVIALLYAVVFNIPYMLIQRYNRPRLLELGRRLEERNKHCAKLHAKGEIKTDENADPELQYGRGTQLLCKGG